MISALNQLVDLVEEHLTEELDLDGLAARLGTTEYHLRRMFSSLAGMPVSEYVRRRRLTVAAADVIADEDDLLGIAVRYGYGSTEAFGRALAGIRINEHRMRAMGFGTFGYKLAAFTMAGGLAGQRHRRY